MEFLAQRFICRPDDFRRSIASDFKIIVVSVNTRHEKRSSLGKKPVKDALPTPWNKPNGNKGANILPVS